MTCCSLTGQSKIKNSELLDELRTRIHTGEIDPDAIQDLLNEFAQSYPVNAEQPAHSPDRAQTVTRLLYIIGIGYLSISLNRKYLSPGQS